MIRLRTTYDPTILSETHLTSPSPDDFDHDALWSHALLRAIEEGKTAAFEGYCNERKAGAHEALEAALDRATVLHQEMMGK